MVLGQSLSWSSWVWGEGRGPRPSPWRAAQTAPGAAAGVLGRPRPDRPRQAGERRQRRGLTLARPGRCRNAAVLPSVLLAWRASAPPAPGGTRSQCHLSGHGEGASLKVTLQMAPGTRHGEESTLPAGISPARLGLPDPGAAGPAQGGWRASPGVSPAEGLRPVGGAVTAGHTASSVGKGGLGPTRPGGGFALLLPCALGLPGAQPRGWPLSRLRTPGATDAQPRGGLQATPRAAEPDDDPQSRWP